MFKMPPAVQALLLQCLALPLTLICLAAAETAAGIEIASGLAAFLQGILAAALSWWRRLDRWWLGIQLLFPLALAGMHALRLPPLLFFWLFLISVLLYWSTFRTRVPYYPSNPAVWRAVMKLLAPDRPLRFIDIGSGFGGLVLHLAALRKDSDFAGIELAPLPWCVSRLRAYGSRASFIHGDYMKLNFADYDVVFAYLSPAAMPALWEKAHTEMRPGALLLSFEFDIPGREPDITMHPTTQGPALLGWRF